MSRAASGIIGCGLVLVLGVCGCSQQGANSSAPSAATTESAVRFQPNNLKSVRFTDRRADEPLTDPGATVFVAAFPNDCPDQGRLQHELLRQALLVAARDHMGLATCDDSLHDVRGAKDRPARLGILYNTRPKTMFVSVFRETQAEPDIVWEGGQTQASEMSLEDVVTHAEKMSRGELVQALEKAGYQAQSAGRPPQSTATVPESVARLLDDFSFLSQFAALRRLHDEITRQGESLALLGALARAYATLGSVTEYHTNPSQKAAKARALLLAERLVAQHEKTPDAYQVRAYVRAIVGRHASALADIDRARALAGSQNPSGAQTSEPAWLPVIEAFCRFDRRRQEQLAANPDVLPLLRYTQFLMNAFTSSENRRNHAAEALVELRPTCWPALHLLSTCDTLGIRREATAQALTRFPQVLYRQVAKFPGLPEEAAKICAKQSASGAGGAENPVDFVAEMGQRAQLIQALNRAADSAEPSLGYLAALITDTGFQQAKTVLQLEGMLGVSRRESLAALLPLYQDHRFVSYLKYLGAANRQDPNVKESLLSSLEAQAIDLDPTAVMMVVPTQSHARGRAFQLQLRCLSRTDPLYTDLAGARRGAQRSGTEIPNKNQFDLSKVSPNCPQAVAFMVFSGGASSIQQTDAEIEAKYGDEPEVLTAMANRYQNQKGNSADAIHWLKLAAKASGDHRAYSQLATYYHRQGQFAEWRAALDDYLALEPEPGLQRPKTQVEIADYLMRLGEYKAALPYATEAAECYAAWALQCAHRCYDYLGDWARAEAYVRAQVERYDEAFPDWLEWCLWRGRGNVEAARKFAAASAAAVGDNVPDHIVVDLARYYLLIGDAKQALPVVEKVFATRRRHDWEWGLRAAIISDTLEDIAARDKYLSEVAYPPDLRTVANPSHTQLLAQVLSDGFRATDGPQFDLNQIDKILSEIPDNPYAYKTDCQYFGGWFLLKYGPRDKALEYLQQVASSPAATSNRALAAIRLRQEGLEVPPTRVKE